MLINGTSDPINPYQGGIVTLFGFASRGTVMSSVASAQNFATRNGITTQPTLGEVPQLKSKRVAFSRNTVANPFGGRDLLKYLKTRSENDAHHRPLFLRFCLKKRAYSGLAPAYCLTQSSKHWYAILLIIQFQLSDCFHGSKNPRGAFMIASLAFTGMILVTGSGSTVLYV
jgi:hypothetical protein